ncbi:MAG: lipoate--protein ligase family protein [Verrucomicrobia bacterium]|nr:lipoate--protein ligase family protein [Verrucomicrobiota bacterium]
MRCLDVTLPTAAENLACDEALLEAAEAGEGGAALRFWEPRDPFVVLGYTNHASLEIDAPACVAAGVPVYRRISGGGTVLQGPGCLNYALILPIQPGTPLAGIATTNAFIMQRLAQALSPPHQPLRVRGFTDLTLGDRKCSGNAQRRRQRFLLFHGAFLLDADFALIQRCLRPPSRQPDYRRHRPHHAFLTNLPWPASRVKAALRHAWQAAADTRELPRERIARLIAEKYGLPAWNLKYP